MLKVKVQGVHNNLLQAPDSLDDEGNQQGGPTTERVLRVCWLGEKLGGAAIDADIEDQLLRSVCRRGPLASSSA